MKRYAIIALVAVAVVFFAVKQVESCAERGDVKFYFPAGKAVLAGDELYGSSCIGGGYLYPPFFALLMVPFALLPHYVGAAVWFVLGAASLFFFFAISLYFVEAPSARLAPWLREKLRALSHGKFNLVLVLAAVLAGRFWLDNLRYGLVDVHLWSLSLLGVYFAVSGRRVMGGALLGLTMATKPITATVLFFLLLRREYRAPLFAMALVAVLYLAPAAVLGWGRNAELLGVWYERVVRSASTEFYVYAYEYNQSFPSLAFSYANLLRGGGSAALSMVPPAFPYIKWAGNVLAALAVAVASVKYLRRPRAPAESFWNAPASCTVLALVMLTGVIFEPLSWVGYYVATLFPYVVVLYAARNWAGKGVAVALYVLLGLSFLIHSVVGADFWGAETKEMLLDYKCVTWSALLVYAALLVALFGAFRARRAEA
jgi:hypothetical protein